MIKKTKKGYVIKSKGILQRLFSKPLFVKISNNNVLTEETCLLCRNDYNQDLIEAFVFNSEDKLVGFVCDHCLRKEAPELYLERSEKLSEIYKKIESLGVSQYIENIKEENEKNKNK